MQTTSVAEQPTTVEYHHYRASGLVHGRPAALDVPARLTRLLGYLPSRLCRHGRRLGRRRNSRHRLRRHSQGAVGSRSAQRPRPAARASSCRR